MNQVRAQSQYRVLERLASGGMAEVFHAVSTGLGGFEKPVAIKRVLPHLASDKRFIQMFLDEARLSARLNHRNIVQVFDVGHAEDVYFIVMEYVDGVTLKAVLDHLRKRGEMLPTPIAVHIAVEVSNGLHYAHRLKDSSGRRLEIVHRDVSPANVLMSRAGGVKLADFGLAKAASQLVQSDPGVVKGKFSYLAPETASGEGADALADQFAIGAVLWEMLAGRKLFPGDNDWQTVKRVRDCRIPSVREFNPGVPEQLCTLLSRVLARDKADRFPSAGDFSRALTEFLFANGHPVTSEDLAILVHEVLDVRYTNRVTAAQPRSDPARKLLEEQLMRLEAISGNSSGSGASQAVGPVPGDHTESIMPPPPASDSVASVVDEVPTPLSTRATKPAATATATATASVVSTPPAMPTATTASAPPGSVKASAAASTEPQAAMPTATATPSLAGREVPVAPVRRKRFSRGVTLAGLLGASVVGAGAAYVTGALPLHPIGPLGARAPRATERAAAAGLAPRAIAPRAPASPGPGSSVATARPSAATPPSPVAATAPSSDPLPGQPGFRVRSQMMLTIEEGIRACEARDAEHHGRHVRIQAVYAGTTGRATSVSLPGTYFAGRPIGACIERAVRAVPAPRFAAAQWATDFEFMLR